MSVERHTYRLESVRNGPTVVPLELEAGLIERSTPALAYRIALGDAQCPGRHWEEQLHASHRQPPSRSTLERIAKRLGEGMREVAPEILSVVRDTEDIIERAHAVCVGLDRTTIPMEESLQPGDTRDPELKRRNKPYIRKPPGPVEVNYRMGYVGTVCIVDVDGECVRTLKYSCSADQDPSVEVTKMIQDVLHLQNQRTSAGQPPLPLGIVQDGAPEMWRLVEEEIQRAMPDANLDKAIDRYHLAERLAEALKALGLYSSHREELLKGWRAELNTNDDAIDAIEARLKRERRKATADRPLTRANVEIVRSHLVYIKNNKSKMRYASIRRKGLPVASGATEGACKSVIALRAKRSGQRWHSPGVNSVLTLRGLHLSDRLRPAWNAFAETRRAELKAVA